MNTSYKKLSFLVFLTVIIAFITVFISCSSPTEPIISLDDSYFDNFWGQLESDFGDQAILKSDGTLWVWGGNTTGRLGNGTMNPSEIPVQIKTIDNVVAIDFLEGAAVAADIKGNIWFWGDRLIWNEGSYDTVVTKLKQISNLSGTVSLEIRGSNINLLRIDGTVWRLLWDHRTPSKYLIPEKINGMDNISQIANDLALKKNGKLCAFPGRETGMPEKYGLIESLDNIIQIYEMYHRYTVILKKDNTVWAWGKNYCGNLGNGTFEDSEVPVKVKNIEHIKAISIDGSRCLALKNDGTVWFWGLSYLNSYQNIETCYTSPIKVDGLEDVKLIKVGGTDLSVIMKSDNTIWVFDPRVLKPRKIPFP